MSGYAKIKRQINFWKNITNQLQLIIEFMKREEMGQKELEELIYTLQSSLELLTTKLNQARLSESEFHEVSSYEIIVKLSTLREQITSLIKTHSLEIFSQPIPKKVTTLER